MNRFCDIFLSSAAIVLLLPVLLPIAAILLCTGEKEIFYIQNRIGRNGKIFGIIKFATMLKNSPKIGTGTITVENDPRVLPVGKILRKSKINELPQLLNVLRGDMSIVGPRPLTLETFKEYDENVQKIITAVKPGISGIGSIIFRDEEKYLSGVSNAQEVYRTKIAPYKGKLETWYVKKRSIRLYFLLILLTVYVVLTSKKEIVYFIFPDLPRQDFD